MYNPKQAVEKQGLGAGLSATGVITTIENGKTVYSSNSNLGKYNNYYRKLPEAGDQVRCLTNKDGFFRLLIE